MIVMHLSVFGYMHGLKENSKCQYNVHYITKLHKYVGW